ncbi:hypothetical protein [Humibacillus xanthopallidus]|nr:hypothetical protein [Humibacillus xanthopallidus]
MSPVGFGASGIGMVAMGLAQVFPLSPVVDILSAAGVLAFLVGLGDVALASLVGPPPARDPAASADAVRQLGQTLTFGSDRQLLVALLLGTTGFSLVSYVFPPPGGMAWVRVLFVAMWLASTVAMAVLVVRSGSLGIRIDDLGVYGSPLPWSRCFVAWDQIVGAHVMATDSVMTKVVLELPEEPGRASRSRRITAGYLLAGSQQVCDAITADPRFRGARRVNVDADG